MKTWKLDREPNELIMKQIDWLNKMNGVDLTADDVMELSTKTKKELIQIWISCYKLVQNPTADWLEIYY